MKLLKEPLLHFVVLGGLLFACFQWFDPETAAPGDTEVRVTEGRVRQLAAIFAKTWQRPPSREELQGLVNDFILEEIYYREALAAGLDQNDTLIRRRMRQKVEFLTDDLAVTAPTDETLQAFLDEQPDRFRTPGTLTFQQVFFQPDRLGEDRETALRAVEAA